jgi:hypothetical protein
MKTNVKKIDKEDVKKFYLKCKSVKKTAEHFNCSKTPIIKILKSLNVTTGGVKPFVDTIDVNEFSERYLKLRTCKKMSIHYGVSEKVIRMTIKKCNIVPVKRYDDDMIIQTYVETNSISMTRTICGVTVYAIRKILKANGIEESEGNPKKHMKYSIGDRQNHWTISGIVRKDSRKHFIINCVCGTTKETKRPFESNSCGCDGMLYGYFGRKENNTKALIGYTSRKDPYRLNWHHRWKAMVRRCHVKTDKQYYNYGGRGIKVCNRWLKPNGVGSENYYNDIHEILGPQPSPDHSLDRIENDDMYEISNLRWATNEEQTHNRRISLVMKSQDNNHKLKL